MATTHYGTRAGRRICDIDLSSELGAWSTFVPTLSAGSGTFTSASATGRYKTLGKTTFITITITITTNGTAATYVRASLPNTSNTYCVLAGRGTQLSGNALVGQIDPSATAVLIFNYNNTYPGASGEVLVVSGVYENT